MEQFRLKDIETGETIDFFGDVIAERKIMLKDQDGILSRFGVCRFFKLQDLPKNPGYVIAIEIVPGEFDIEPLQDPYVVNRFGEFTLRTPEHFLHMYFLALLRDAAAVDVALFDVVQTLADLRQSLIDCPPEPAFKPKGKAIGFFEAENPFPSGDELPTI
jgi:hypothetical protein